MFNQLRAVLGGVFDAVSGIGSSDDPGRRFTFDTSLENYTDSQIISAYTKSGLIQKIIELIPNTASQCDIEDLSPGLQETLNEWKILQRFKEASIAARLFKESYLILNIDDNLATDQPIDNESAFNLLDIYQVDTGQITFDVDTYQNRTMYYLMLENNIKIPIHPDRVLLFVGKHYPAKIRTSTKGLNGSAIAGIMGGYGMVSHAMNISLSLLARVTTFVFKMHKLQDLIKSGDENLILSRLNIHKRGIGSIGGLVIDAETEDVEWLNLNLSGVPEVIRLQREMFTAETELTHDQLWNEGSQQTASALESQNFENKVNEFIQVYWQDNFNLMCQILDPSYVSVPLMYMSPYTKQMKEQEAKEDARIEQQANMKALSNNGDEKTSVKTVL